MMADLGVTDDGDSDDEFLLLTSVQILNQGRFLFLEVYLI